MIKATMLVVVGCDYCDRRSQEEVVMDEDGLPPVRAVVKRLNQFGDYVQIPHLNTLSCKECLTTRMGDRKEPQ